MHLFFERFMALLHNKLHPDDAIAEDHFITTAPFVNYMEDKDRLQTDIPRTSCGDVVSMISAILIRNDFRANQQDVENKFSRLAAFPFQQDQFNQVRQLMGAMIFAFSPSCLDVLQPGCKGILATQLGCNQWMAAPEIDVVPQINRTLDYSTVTTDKSVVSQRRSCRLKKDVEKETFPDFLARFLFVRNFDDFDREWNRELAIDWPKLRENVSSVTLLDSPRHLDNCGNRCFLNAPLSAMSHLLKREWIHGCFETQDTGNLCESFLQTILLLRMGDAGIVGIEITKHKKVANANFASLLLTALKEDGKISHKASGKIDDFGDPIAVVETLMGHVKQTLFGRAFFSPAEAVFPYFAVPAQGAARKSRILLSELVDEANLNVAGDFSKTSTCEIIILKLENFSSTGSLSLSAYLEKAYMDYPFSYCTSESDEHVAIIADDNQRVNDRIASLTMDGKQGMKECVCLRIFQQCTQKIKAQLSVERGIDMFPWASYFQQHSSISSGLDNFGLAHDQKSVLLLSLPDFLQHDICGVSSSTTIAVGSPPVLDLNQAILVLCQVAHEVYHRNEEFEDQGAAHTLMHDATCTASNLNYKAPLLGSFVIGECYFATSSAIVQIGAHFVTYLFDETFSQWEYVNDTNHKERKQTRFTSTEHLQGRVRMIFARRILNPSLTQGVSAKPMPSQAKPSQIADVVTEGISLLC